MPSFARYSEFGVSTGIQVTSPRGIEYSVALTVTPRATGRVLFLVPKLTFLRSALSLRGRSTYGQVEHSRWSSESGRLLGSPPLASNCPIPNGTLTSVYLSVSCRAHGIKVPLLKSDLPISGQAIGCQIATRNWTAVCQGAYEKPLRPWAKDAIGEGLSWIAGALDIFYDIVVRSEIIWYEQVAAPIGRDTCPPPSYFARGCS